MDWIGEQKTKNSLPVNLSSALGKTVAFHLLQIEKKNDIFALIINFSNIVNHTRTLFFLEFKIGGIIVQIKRFFFQVKLFSNDNIPKIRTINLKVS